MRKSVVYALLAAFVFVLPNRAADKEENSAKEALKNLNDFIGEWKGSGAPEKAKPASKEIWSETVQWGWKFKGDDAWITLAFKNGKYFKSGEIRYGAEKKNYELTLLDKAGKKLLFDGEYKEGYLTMDRTDPDSKEGQRLTMNLAGDGARLIYRYSHKPADRTLFIKDYQVACTKEGESLGAKEKKIECVVSGGLGTIPVSYQGETFYVCCSGCKDAFAENPAKYVAEFKAKKSKK